MDRLREIITIDCVGHSEKLCLDKVLDLWNEYHCEKCGVGISFNLLDSKKYLEELPDVTTDTPTPVSFLIEPEGNA